MRDIFSIEYISNLEVLYRSWVNQGKLQSEQGVLDCRIIL